MLQRVVDHFKSNGVAVDTSAFDQQPSSDFTNKRVTLPPLPDEHIRAMRMSEQQLNLRGYSLNTRRTYLQQLKQFFTFYNSTSPIDITETEVQNYMLYLVEKKRVSRSTQGQAINAIKFFFKRVLKQERKVYHLVRPLPERRLPEVLSAEEVVSIFEKNLKQLNLS
jgi:site-specific recombinase XerD